MKENNRKKSKFFAGVASFAAAIALFAVGGFAYYTPTSYVSLDVNPSIEYSVNLIDRVLEVKAVNDDGKEIVYNLDIKNKKIAEAVEETVDKLIEGGFITKDENAGVIIAVENSNKDKADQLVKELKEKTQKHIDEKTETAKVEVEAVGKARVEEAKTLGVTPGKLNLVQKLQKSAADPTKIVTEEWLDKSVKEINKAIKENRKLLKNSSKDTIVNQEQNKPVDTDDKDKNSNTNKPVKENEKSAINKDVKVDVNEQDEEDAVIITGASDEDNDKDKTEKSNNGKSESNKK